MFLWKEARSEDTYPMEKNNFAPWVAGLQFYSSQASEFIPTEPRWNFLLQIIALSHFSPSQSYHTFI